MVPYIGSTKSSTAPLLKLWKWKNLHSNPCNNICMSGIKPITELARLRSTVITTWYQQISSKATHLFHIFNAWLGHLVHTALVVGRDPLQEGHLLIILLYLQARITLSFLTFQLFVPIPDTSCHIPSLQQWWCFLGVWHRLSLSSDLIPHSSQQCRDQWDLRQHVYIILETEINVVHFSLLSSDWY